MLSSPLNLIHVSVGTQSNALEFDTQLGYGTHFSTEIEKLW